MLRNNAMLADAHISTLGYLWCPICKSSPSFLSLRSVGARLKFQKKGIGTRRLKYLRLRRS